MEVYSAGMDDNNFKTYLFSYYHDGSNWVFELKAKSPEDAQARLQKLPWAKYDGELVMVVPFGWMARLLCRVRNLFHPTSGF